MWKPKVLESDELQSANFVEESSPGAGDGQGWRLCKNGDFQLGKISQVDGVMYTEHTSIRVNHAYDPDVHMRIDAETLRQASIKPANIASNQIEIRMTVGDGGALLDMNEEEKASLAKAIKRCVIDTIESSPLNGTRSGRITDEQTCRAEADTALASRIGAIDLQAWAGVGASLDPQLGKEYLAIPQPGGDVKLGRLGGKPLTAEDFKPGCSPHEFAGGLCRVAPITSNGKAPANILPRGVDDKE